MTLMLVKSPDLPDKFKINPEERLKAVKGEVYSGIEDRIEALRAEALAMKEEMEKILDRIDIQGFEVYLDDLRTGKWYRLATEIKTLQEVIRVIEAVE